MRRPSRFGGLSVGLVSLLALALRLLFWRATPDAAWPSSAAYQGDALTWMDAVQALLQGREFEAGLPWRPPGMTWLLSWLGGGQAADVAMLKLVWCVLGAVVVLVVYRAVRRDFGELPALITGLFCAASTGLLILSTSLNNETPWLLLAVLGVAWLEPLRRQPTMPLACAWGAVNAAACLMRPEHLLFVVAGGAWIALGRQRSRGARGVQAWRPLALAGLTFVALLAPWHLRAWSQVAAFNDTSVSLPPAEEARMAALEAVLAPVSWDAEAQAALERLPAYSRRAAGLFVTATVAHRGERQVGVEDLQTLEEAFGTLPVALPEHFFVALYGGLNFYLANNAEAVAGFTRGPLETPPPLTGGASRFPAPLIAGLPPPELALVYPPHAEAVAHGYRLGWKWIAGHPAEALARAGRKLGRFWSGAALGWTGYNFPTGLSGLRRQVDLVVPEGVWGAGVSPLLMLVGCGAGLVAGRRNAALVPWLVFFASRAVTAVAFFGYARVGATVIPTVALLLALAAVAAGRRLRAIVGGTVAGPRKPPEDRMTRRRLAVAGLAALLLVAVETVRWASRPVPWLDGRPAGTTDPFPDEYRDMRLELRSGSDTG